MLTEKSTTSFSHILVICHFWFNSALLFLFKISISTSGFWKQAWIACFFPHNISEILLLHSTDCRVAVYSGTGKTCRRQSSTDNCNYKQNYEKEKNKTNKKKRKKHSHKRACCFKNVWIDNCPWLGDSEIGMTWERCSNFYNWLPDLLA